MDNPEITKTFMLKRKSKHYQSTLLLFKNKSIQKYFTHIKSRTRNKGYISKNTVSITILSTIKFLNYINIPITKNVIDKLIQQKIDNPKNYFIDDKLEEFSNENPLIIHRCYATYIKGIFKANRTTLYTYIDNHFQSETQIISEGILIQIISELDEQKQLMIYLQAFSGQRINCLSTVSFDQYEKINNQYTTIKIYWHQNKSRLTHYTIIPTYLAEKIIKYASKNKRNTPFPTYISQWQEITKYAKRKHNVRLTSHYLRKRFFSIAENTPMPVNHWDYLMGSKKREGHCAENYSLNDTTKLIQEYDTYLMKPLSLDKNHQDISSTSIKNPETENLNTKLLKEILNELKQLNKRNISSTQS